MMTISEDFVETLGIAVLPHHLRRLIDEMIEANAAAYEQMGLKTPVRASSLMRLLARDGAMGVVEIARALGLSHPLIIRFSKQLQDAGLIEIVQSETDGRSRLLRLTRTGRAEVRAIEAFHRAAAQTYSAIAEETGLDLFAAARATREAFKANPLADRISQTLQTEASS